jgi:hypothetical protein
VGTESCSNEKNWKFLHFHQLSDIIHAT